MDRSSPAGLALALVLGSPPRKLLVVQHPAAPLWAGSRTALVAVGGAVLWWAVSCRVLLGSFRLGAGCSFSGVNFSFRTLSVRPVPLEASIGAANPGLCVATFADRSLVAYPDRLALACRDGRDALWGGLGARVPHRLGVDWGGDVQSHQHALPAVRCWRSSSPGPRSGPPTAAVGVLQALCALFWVCCRRRSAPTGRSAPPYGPPTVEARVLQALRALFWVRRCLRTPACPCRSAASRSNS